MYVNDSVGLTKKNAICPARLQCHATVILALSTIAQESQQSASRGCVLTFYRIAPCLRIEYVAFTLLTRGNSESA